MINDLTYLIFLLGYGSLIAIIIYSLSQLFNYLSRTYLFILLYCLSVIARPS